MSDDTTDTKVTSLFAGRTPPPAKAEKKSTSELWEIVLDDSGVLNIEGHLVLNGMVVAVMSDPDDSFSITFYAPAETVKYVKRLERT